MSSCYLSVVIPAYNEERRLPETLAVVSDYLSRLPGMWEIIVVDDGSNDGTAAIVQDFAQRDARLRLITLPHRGKGSAVKYGMLAAVGEYRFLCDADLSMPIEFLERLLPPRAPATDIVIGSREAPGARRLGEPRRRRLMGRAFNAMTRLLAVPGIADTQCGFKVFRRETAQALFAQQTLDGFAFDVELLAIASRSGLRIREVPIDWHHRQASTLKPFPDSLVMARDLLRIRWRALTGRYR